MRPRGNPVLGTICALAIAFAIYLQLQVQDEVFFACDGGLKTLQRKQLARGEWHADLRLPAPAWAHTALCVTLRPGAAAREPSEVAGKNSKDWFQVLEIGLLTRSETLLEWPASKPIAARRAPTPHHVWSWSLRLEKAERQYLEPTSC